MHYHYFTIEQREGLKQIGGDIAFARLAADPGLRLCGRCHG